MHTAVSILDCQ